MITPPLTVERVLEALSAKTAFRDGVLGDLAEEFAHRAERHGVGSAQRWYYHEAVRVAPHLLRDLARSLSAHDVFYLTLVTGVSYGVMWVFALAVIRTEQTVMRALGLPIGLILNGTVNAGIGALGGAFAARVSKETPLLCAIGVGLIYTGYVMLTGAFSPFHRSISYWQMAVLWSIVMLVGTTIGGVLRVRAVGASQLAN